MSRLRVRPGPARRDSSRAYQSAECAETEDDDVGAEAPARSSTRGGLLDGTKPPGARKAEHDGGGGGGFKDRGPIAAPPGFAFPDQQKKLERMRMHQPLVSISALEAWPRAAIVR